MFPLNFFLLSCLLSSFFLLYFASLLSCLCCFFWFPLGRGPEWFLTRSDEVRNDVQFFSLILGRWYYPGRVARA
jgi:hypothetical protein